MEGPEFSMRIRVRALTHGKCVRIENSGPSIVVTAVLIHTRTTHCSKSLCKLRKSVRKRTANGGSFHKMQKLFS